MIQKATAMCNWWLAASSQQCACSCITSHACRVFWWNIKSPRWLSAPTAQIWHLETSGFSQLKSLLKGKRFQSINEIQENVMGQLMVFGRTVWGPTVPTSKGTEASWSYIQCFLNLVSSSTNVSIFHDTWMYTFWTDLACVSNLWPAGRMQLKTAVNVAQHKIINLLKTLWDSFGDYMLQCIQCVAQDNSSSSVAQRHQKVGQPWQWLPLTLGLWVLSFSFVWFSFSKVPIIRT